MTKRYVVVYPVFAGSENYFFDTLEEVIQNIEDFTIADSEDEKAHVKVYEIKREIDVKTLLSGREE